MIANKDIAIKELSKQLTGYCTVTRVLLDSTNYFVSDQISGVEDNFGSYELNVNSSVRLIDLLETNLQQYYNKWFVFVVRKHWILNVIPTHAKPVLNILTKS